MPLWRVIVPCAYDVIRKEGVPPNGAIADEKPPEPRKAANTPGQESARGEQIHGATLGGEVVCCSFILSGCIGYQPRAALTRCFLCTP